MLSSVLFLPENIIGNIERYLRAGATHIELVTHSFPHRIELIGDKVLSYFIESGKYELLDTHSWQRYFKMQ
jgi:hypothetical protein